MLASILAERWSVKDTTIGPQSVQTTVQTNCGVWAYVALEGLSVVTNLRQRVQERIVGQAEHCAVRTFNTQQTLYASRCVLAS